MASERDIFANFERVRREMDELFGDVFGRSALAPRGRAFTPAIDVYYRDDPPTAVVQARLPGINPADLTLEVEGRRLVLAGRRDPEPAEGRLYQQIEIVHGPFRRVVELGADVRGEHAKASYEDGVLRVELPLIAPTSRSVPVQVPRGERRTGG